VCLESYGTMRDDNKLPLDIAEAIEKIFLLSIVEKTQDSSFHRIMLFLGDEPDDLPPNIHGTTIRKLVSNKHSRLLTHELILLIL
jgi:hypothetical protein